MLTRTSTGMTRSSTLAAEPSTVATSVRVYWGASEATGRSMTDPTARAAPWITAGEGA